MNTQVITDASQFAALQPEWDAVLSASALDGPFLRHAWLSAWWNAFGRGELAVLTCRDDDSGELLGVLPAYRCSVGPLLPTRTIRLLGSGKGGSTGLGAFALPHAEEAVSEAIARTLLDATDSWDSVELRPVSDNDAFATYAAGRLRCSRSVGAIRVRQALSARPCVDLPATWDEYLAKSLSHDARRNVRRCLRRAEELGATVEMILDGEALPAALDEALAIHESRMRDVVGPGYSLTPARRAFTHATCKTLLAENRLRLMFLVMDGQRVACECQMRHGDTRYAMWSGFLGEFAHAEVTKTLFSHAVRGAIDEGCTVLDFGLGEQDYKSSWGVTRVERFGSLSAYSSGVRGRLANGRDASVIWAQRSLDSAPPSVRKPLWRVAQSASKLIR